VSESPTGLAAATTKVLSSIEDPALARRYPDRTHFVPADHPKQAMMVTRALFAGEPVAVVERDGREVLFTPEHARGVVALLLLAAVAVMRLRRDSGDVIQLPPRTTIEVRDARGLPVAA
jgi:hypothetical protein